jgi:hypothetical protein
LHALHHMSICIRILALPNPLILVGSFWTYPGLNVI